MSDDFAPLTWQTTARPTASEGANTSSVGSDVVSYVNKISQKLHEKYLPSKAYLLEAPYDSAWQSTQERLSRRAVRKVKHLGLDEVSNKEAFRTTVDARYEPSSNYVTAECKVEWKQDPAQTGVTQRTSGWGEIKRQLTGKSSTRRGPTTFKVSARFHTDSASAVTAEEDDNTEGNEG